MVLYESKKVQERRHRLTLNFLQRHIPVNNRILDLGGKNNLSAKMEKSGYWVKNSQPGTDLDVKHAIVTDKLYDVVTAFQIFEHMFAPFNILMAINAPILVASVPLKVWFTGASRGEGRENHYHEFEQWQFDLLLERTGWKVIASEKWTGPVFRFGIRPLIRKFTPRYYIVYCRRH